MNYNSAEYEAYLTNPLEDRYPAEKPWPYCYGCDEFHDDCKCDTNHSSKVFTKAPPGE